MRISSKRTKLTLKILHRGSTFARMKLKEIGGIGTKQWNMMFNAMIHAKPYQSMKLKKVRC